MGRILLWRKFYFWKGLLNYWGCVCLVVQLCPTLCDPRDWNPPGSPVHGILQERMLEWVAISSSRGSSWPGQGQGRGWALNPGLPHCRWILYHLSHWGSLKFLVAQLVKNLPCSARDPGLIPGSGRYPGEGNGNPLQHPCLENLMDRGTWWAALHGVTKSRAWLSNWHLLTYLLKGIKMLIFLEHLLHAWYFHSLLFILTKILCSRR